MAKPTVRVNIPSNAQELIILMRKVLARHAADGAKSPLNAINVKDFAAKVTTAETANNLAQKLRHESETANEERNLALGIANGQISSTNGTALYYLKGVREILLGVYKGREHKLGDWGFNVDTSPKVKEKAEEKPAPES